MKPHPIFVCSSISREVMLGAAILGALSGLIAAGCSGDVRRTALAPLLLFLYPICAERLVLVSNPLSVAIQGDTLFLGNELIPRSEVVAWETVLPSNVAVIVVQTEKQMWWLITEDQPTASKLTDWLGPTPNEGSLRFVRSCLEPLIAVPCSVVALLSIAVWKPPSFFRPIAVELQDWLWPFAFVIGVLLISLFFRRRLLDVGPATVRIKSTLEVSRLKVYASSLGFLRIVSGKVSALVRPARALGYDARRLVGENDARLIAMVLQKRIETAKRLASQSFR